MLQKKKLYHVKGNFWYKNIVQFIFLLACVQLFMGQQKASRVNGDVFNEKFWGRFFYSVMFKFTRTSKNRLHCNWNVWSIGLYFQI